MRYCFNCRRLTAGNPLFCNHCGRTYNVKLCPRLHVNPRNAVVCAQCGSQDLTLPQPKAPLWAKPLMAGASLIPGIILMALTVWLLLEFIHVLVSDPAMELRVMLLGFFLGLLWYGYIHLPSFIRKAISRTVHRKKDKS